METEKKPEIKLVSTIILESEQDIQGGITIKGNCGPDYCGPDKCGPDYDDCKPNDKPKMTSIVI